MNRKFWIRKTALVIVLAVCLVPPPMFPASVQASAANQPDGELYDLSEHDTALHDDEDITEPAANDADEGMSPELNEAEDEPLLQEASGLIRSSRSVPGYNVFEVDSFDNLAEALSTTSYPHAEYSETSVYILLTGNVEIESELTLNSSIEKIIIDGDSQYTLSETNFARTHVSANTTEVTFRDLSINGYQYYGLFDNTHGTEVIYTYERVDYTGPQILWAFNSTAHFYDCDIHIIAAGNDANEVAEIQDVFIYGSNRFDHDSAHSVFRLYNSGSLVLSGEAALRINAVGDNSYILYTENGWSTLRLEDGALLQVGGHSSQLAGNAGLHSIYLGSDAAFHWEAVRPGSDYIAVNANGGAKEALRLSAGAEFRIAPSGPVSDRLLSINSGDVVVGEGAGLILDADNYTTTAAPFALAGGSALTIGRSAALLLEIGNSVNITFGLISFNGTGRFTVSRDATVVIRGNQAIGAVYFFGRSSSVEITALNYLEIAAANGNPFYFNMASPTDRSTLIYTDVQQINYWAAGSATCLAGGMPARRWLSRSNGISVRVQTTANGNAGLSVMMTGGTLDPEWTATLNSSNFQWADAAILSVGKMKMDFDTAGNTVEGYLTAPLFNAPYTQGAVQLRRQQNGYEAVSPSESAVPEFRVTPDQPVGDQQELSLWGEYGYLFIHEPTILSDPVLSFLAPDQIRFGTIAISFSDMEVSAEESYALQVQAGINTDWQILASFSGFSSADKRLDGTLVVNDVPLQEIPQQIAAAAGNKTVLLEAALRVQGGAADTGTFTGSITWTLVDTP